MSAEDDLARKERLLASYRQITLGSTLKAFQKGTKTIRDRMNRLLDKTVETGGFSSSTEAKKWLKQNCTKETVQDLYRQINDSNLTESQRKEAVKKMDTLSRGYGFTRQKALEETVKIQTQSIQNSIHDRNLPTFMQMGEDINAHAMFETQKKSQMGFKLDEIPNKLINKSIDHSFTATTSVGYVKTVTEAMKSAFIQGLIEGKSTNDIQIAVKGAEGKKEWVSKAFVRTMLTEVSNEVEADSLKDAGFEKYEFVCNLDERTCPVCGRLDGKVFLLKDRQAGVNFPPMHRNCRCTTAPAMTKDAKSRMMRKFSLKDEKGRKHYDTVSSDMTYEEWAEKYYPKGADRVAKEDINKQKTMSVSEVDDLHPRQLGGVERGEPMSLENADAGNSNPNFRKGGNYTVNCQTCVVTFEARRRGYDLEALPLSTPEQDQLSRMTTLAWRDVDTGAHPTQERFDTEALGVKKTPEACFDWLETVVKVGERYTFEHTNKGYTDTGHIISAERDDEGNLMLIDPQCGDIRRGADRVMDYIRRFVSVKQKYVANQPSLLRVDDKAFDENMVNAIVKKKERK